MNILLGKKAAVCLVFSGSIHPFLVNFYINNNNELKSDIFQDLWIYNEISFVKKCAEMIKKVFF